MRNMKELVKTNTAELSNYWWYLKEHVVIARGEDWWGRTSLGTWVDEVASHAEIFTLTAASNTLSTVAWRPAPRPANRLQTPFECDKHKLILMHELVTLFKTCPTGQTQSPVEFYDTKTSDGMCGEYCFGHNKLTSTRGPEQVFGLHKPSTISFRTELHVSRLMHRLVAELSKRPVAHTQRPLSTFCKIQNSISHVVYYGRL